MRATSWLVTTKSKGHQDADGRARRRVGRCQPAADWQSAPRPLRVLTPHDAHNASETLVRTKEKSAEAVVVEKRSNVGGAKGPRTKERS
jgi:hypothetical protein